MNRTRPWIVLVALISLGLTGAGVGISELWTFARTLIVTKTVDWEALFGAELFLLLGWRIIQWASSPILALAGKRSMNDEPAIKRGLGVRLAFLGGMFASLILFPFTYFVLNLFFAIPAWYGKLGSPVAMVLLFLAFTYPWRTTERVDPSGLR